jgi:serine/threonine-protein kinase
VIEDGIDEETGDLFIVMELLEGEDLQQLIQRTGPLAPQLALRLVGQALQGLHQAHEAGIVHRDIKPGNIFLARRGEREMVVKILDFGVAKMMGEGHDLANGPALTTTGGFLGSPMFMSPEQVKSSKHVDRRSDIWAIGSVLYCALSGRAPHEADAASVGKLILAICNTPAPQIEGIAPWVPLPVSQILARALAIDPRKRYASAAEMLEAIRPFAPDLTLREDMWKDLPVLVAVPPPPADDGEMDEHDAPPSSLARTETVEQLEASARPPASVFPDRMAVTLPGEAVADTMASSPPSGGATAEEAAASAPGEAATDRPSSSRRDRTAEPAPSPSREGRGAPDSGEDRGATDSRARASSPGLRGGGRGRRGAIAVGAALLACGLAAAALRPQTPQTDHSLSPNSASSAAASAATSGPVLRLRLRISPADATAFVDGAQVVSDTGSVELAGAPGSVHEVRLEKGGGAFRTSVLLTEKGLLPPEIELVTLPPSPSSAAPTASADAPPLSVGSQAAQNPGAPGARNPTSKASGDRSPKEPPPPKEPPSTATSPSEPPPVPKPPADDLMHDHR